MDVIYYIIILLLTLPPPSLAFNCGIIIYNVCTQTNLHSGSMNSTCCFTLRLDLRIRLRDLRDLGSSVWRVFLEDLLLDRRLKEDVVTSLICLYKWRKEVKTCWIFVLVFALQVVHETLSNQELTLIDLCFHSIIRMTITRARRIRESEALHA